MMELKQNPSGTAPDYLLGGTNMYYTNGNYEAFTHPRKPKDVDAKSA